MDAAPRVALVRSQLEIERGVQAADPPDTPG